MGHVLKANQVRLDEPLRLSIKGTGAPEQPDSDRPQLHPRVHVAEAAEDFAVLEVVCSCGRVIHVRCEYAATPPTSAATGPGGRKNGGE